MLSEEYKQFIMDNEELLKEDNYTEFFKMIPHHVRCVLAEFFLLDCDIDFLDYMENIEACLFRYSTRIESINLNSSINEIKSSAFRNCINLKSINLENIEIVWRSAFKNCSSLENLDLSSAKEISDGAFEGCTSLKSIKLPEKFKDSLKIIGIDDNQTKIIWC